MSNILWRLFEITQAFWGIVLAVCAFLLMLAVIGAVIIFLIILMTAIII